ncbi:MAG: hypothetical protein K5930_13330 [Treponemataceae bacterium]|nr:hypothetical protein [Treponemataceae bacterium]
MNTKTKVFTVIGLIFGLIGLTFVTLSIVKNEMRFLSIGMGAAVIGQACVIVLYRNRKKKGE